jgi:hypothetical protein
MCWDLDQGAATVALFDHIQKIVPFKILEGSKTPIIYDQQIINWITGGSGGVRNHHPGRPDPLKS